MSTISQKLKDRINEICTFVGFDYNDKPCGIDPISTTHFEMWCGEDYLVAKSIDEVMSTPLFEGKSLTDIAEDVCNIEW